MKLYFAPDACSLAPHIVLRELALPFTLIRVNNRNKRCADGEDFYRINPKGYVAALQLDDGNVITEGPAIVQYLADCAQSAGWRRHRRPLSEYGCRNGLISSPARSMPAPPLYSMMPCPTAPRRCCATS